MLVVAGTIVNIHKKRTELKTPSEAKFARSLPDDSRSVLENCDKLTLYSLKPAYNFNTDGSAFQGGFHDYPVLGKTEIPADRRNEVLAQLYNGMANSSGQMAGCFNPHHALRAVKGKRYVDIVICFGCMQMQIYTEKHKDYDLDGISSAPRLAFDRILKDGKVKLSE